ncbi:MAG: hypothetical protein HOY78_39450 [Saccharothrix sp.]|nr:hypothetical protein [Saccharothrix sp.]
MGIREVDPNKLLAALREDGQPGTGDVRRQVLSTITKVVGGDIVNRWAITTSSMVGTAACAVGWGVAVAGAGRKASARIHLLRDREFYVLCGVCIASNSWNGASRQPLTSLPRCGPVL